MSASRSVARCVFTHRSISAALSSSRLAGMGPMMSPSGYQRPVGLNLKRVCRVIVAKLRWRSHTLARPTIRCSERNPASACDEFIQVSESLFKKVVGGIPILGRQPGTSNVRAISPNRWELARHAETEIEDAEAVLLEASR